MDKNYQFQPLSLTNFNNLVSLFEQVFNKKVIEEYLIKKYHRPVLTDKVYGHFILYKNKPVAFTGAIPYLIQNYEKTELSAQSVDSMVMKEHRGNGLFQALVSKVSDSLMTDGVGSIFGLPNESSAYVFFNRSNWETSEKIQLFLIPVQPKVIAHLKRFTSKIFDKTIVNKLSPYITDHVPSSMKLNDHVVILAHDENYYRYKKLIGDYHFMAIDGINLWIKMNQDYLSIGDLSIPDSTSKFIKTMGKLSAIARKIGISKIIFQCSPSHPLNSFFEHSYNPHESWRLGYNNFSSKLDLSKLVITYGDVDTF